MAVMVLLAVNSVLLAVTGAGMVSHPERPPIGWKLGSLPSPARMRVLGWVVIGIAVVSAIFDAVLIAFSW